MKNKICDKWHIYPRLAEKDMHGGMRLYNQVKASKANEPLITVITVVYNNEAQIEQCMRSVFAQDYNNVEYIVIDGGSTDSTLAIIKKHEKKIDYFLSAPDNGVYDAMNRGLALAQGDYIVMMNSDDSFSGPSSISEVAFLAVTNPESVIYGQINVLRDGKFLHTGGERDERLLDGFSMPHQATFIASSVYEKVGGYETKYTITADAILLTKIKLAGFHFVYIDKPLANYALGGFSASNWDEGRLDFYLELVDLDVWDLERFCKEILCRFDSQSLFKALRKINLKHKFIQLESVLSKEPYLAQFYGPLQTKKITHFNSHINGGAGIATKRLHQGLQQKEYYSEVITSNAQDGLYVFPIREVQKNATVGKGFQENTYAGNTMFSPPVLGLSHEELAGLIEFSNVVNLHWQGFDLLSLENIAFLSKHSIPVVWTIHDMMPLSGGCHSFHGCLKWQDDCVDCPQLKDNFEQLPAKVLSLKRKYFNFDNITIVALSNHSKAIIEKSIFKNCRIEVIGNSLDIDVFKPYDKQLAKQRFKLPSDKKIICYFPSFKSGMKGSQQLLEALSLIEDKENYHLLLAGRGANSFSIDGFSNTNLGFVGDENELALAYNAADVTLVPSLEETFSNTTAESIACGTPVVGFKVGAIPDLVKNGERGFAVAVGDSEAFSKAIVQVFRQTDMSEACRNFACANLPLEVQAGKYMQLYQGLMNEKQYVKTNNNNLAHSKYGHEIKELSDVRLKLYAKALDIEFQQSKHLHQILAKERKVIAQQGSQVNDLMLKRDLLKREIDKIRKDYWFQFGRFSKKQKIISLIKKGFHRFHIN